jgi:cell division protein FtsB
MEFIEYINSADPEELKKMPGLTAPLGEKVVASRPFASLEDFSNVKGLTEKRLATMLEDFGKKAETEKAEEIEKAAEVSSEEIAEAVGNEVEKLSRKSTIRRVITWIVVLILLAGAVFAVIKWGIPFVYDRYIKPVENNAASITDLADQQNAEIARLDEEIAALQDRAAALEGRADSVDQSLAAHDASLAQLENMQKLLDNNMSTLKTELLAELSNQLSLTRGIELVSRSRLYLSESNFGLAKTDLRAARDLLYTLLDKLPADQVNAMKTVIERIDMALEKLPAYPVVAANDVDTAWQYLVDGLPNVPQQAVNPVVLPPTEAPAATTTEVPTSEATPTVEVTPAP